MNYSRTVFMFPGQGSQYVGMGNDLFERFDRAQEMFNQADKLLGYPLSTLCFQGPEEELIKTLHTQPALYVCGAITAKILMDNGVIPHAVAGHSLGEYTALFAAGVFDFPTGLHLVKARAEAMNSAALETKGTMAALIGLENEDVETVCEESSAKGIVKSANYNCPGQVVISGEPSAVHEAITIAMKKGARKAVELKVSGAFHSPLMEAAARQMEGVLGKSDFQTPQAIFINNADARILSQPDQIRNGLVHQITACVRWSDSMRVLIKEGADCFIEAGPGKVLTGLMRRIDRDAQCVTCSDAASMHMLLEAI